MLYREKSGNPDLQLCRSHDKITTTFKCWMIAPMPADEVTSSFTEIIVRQFQRLLPIPYCRWPRWKKTYKGSMLWSLFSTIFTNFGKKMAFFMETNVGIQFCHIKQHFESKSPFFGENIFSEIITMTPGIMLKRRN
jgi:hypothetical protein